MPICAERNAMPQGMGVVSKVGAHSLGRVPEEELVERKPSVANAT